MKKSLFVLAAAAIMVCFNACVPQVKTLTDYLTAPKKGWVLEAATSTPAYHMEDGSYVENLMEGYLYDYELDDVISFDAEGNETITPGAKIPEEGDYRETVVVKYSIDEVNNHLYCQIPFFYDEALELCKIITLNEDVMKLSCTIDDTENPAKDVYTFNLTYVPAK